MCIHGALVSVSAPYFAISYLLPREYILFSEPITTSLVTNHLFYANFLMHYYNFFVKIPAGNLYFPVPSLVFCPRGVAVSPWPKPHFYNPLLLSL